MKTILISLCVLSIFAGLTSKTLAQSVRTTLGPATNDSCWIWSDQYQCWIWIGPEFQGDYQGHSFFKEYFLNHQFFNFFENAPATFSDPTPSSLPAEGIVLIRRKSWNSASSPHKAWSWLVNERPSDCDR